MDNQKFTTEDGKDLLSKVFAPWVQAQNLTPISFGPQQAEFILLKNEDLLLRVAPDMTSVCGQAIAAAADTAVVLALAGANGRLRKCTTVDLSVNFLRPVPLGDVRLIVDIESNGRKMAVCRIAFYPEGKDKPAALATATFMYLD